MRFSTWTPVYCSGLDVAPPTSLPKQLCVTARRRYGFYQGKLSACEFFYRRELPKLPHLLDLVEHCEATCFNAQPGAFRPGPPARLFTLR
jgi:hypothetical protein